MEFPVFFWFGLSSFWRTKKFLNETFTAVTFMMGSSKTLHQLKEPKLDFCKIVFSLQTQFVCMGGYSVAKKNKRGKEKNFT